MKLLSCFKRIMRMPYQAVMIRIRAVYHAVKKKRLNNFTPTIISSNCFGTFIYHDMGLKFNSPTINLFFNKFDFIKFVTNLKGYIDSDVTEVQDTERPYPVGKITYMGEDVVIYFMHYKSFSEAREKWNNRKERIDYDNIYIIQLISDVQEQDITSFEALPYKHKLLLTNKNLTNSSCVVTHNVFNQDNYRPGQVLEYKNPFSLKRYMDDVDYIDFLNHK